MVIYSYTGPTPDRPFAIQVPNATTVKAMKELADGKGKRFNSADELFQDIGV